MSNLDDDIDEISNGSKNSGTKIIVVITLILCFLSVVVYDTYVGKGVIKEKFAQLASSDAEATDKTVVNNSVVALETDSKTILQAFGKSYVQCSKDGIKYFSSFNNQKWNDTFTMSSPSMISEGIYIAVADVLGRSVRVYNDTGFIYEVKTDNPIIQFSLNKNGYLGLIVNNKNDYRIFTYSVSGEKLIERIENETGIYPVDVDISDGNNVMAVSYLDTTDISIASRIVFFYTSRSGGEEYTDNMFASIEKDGQIIPIIKFMKDGTLAAVSDSSIFAADEKGLEIWSINLTNKIDEVFLDGGEYIVVAYGDALNNAETNKENTIEWINLSGKVKTSFFLDGPASYLNGSSAGIIVGSVKDYYALNNSGKLIWSHKAIQDVIDILFMEKMDKVMYITNNSAILDNIQNIQSNNFEINVENLTDSQGEEGNTPERGANGEAEDINS